MRGGLVAGAVILALLVAVPIGGAASGPPTASVQSMKLTESTHAARAHGVRLTITLRYLMQCGYPGAGALVVTFPSAAKLPDRFATGSVRLAGNAVAARLEGRNVTVTIPRHKGVLCNTMGPGTLTLTFTHAAKFGNPAHVGSYGFTATHAKHTFKAKLVIKPAA